MKSLTVIYASGLIIGLLVGQNYPPGSFWSWFIVVASVTAMSWDIYKTIKLDLKRIKATKEEREINKKIRENINHIGKILASTPRFPAKRRTLSGKEATDEVKKKAEALFKEKIGADWGVIPEPIRENWYRMIEEQDDPIQKGAEL